jgi:hypothetical protein
MPQVFYFPAYQALSGSGTPLPGAKLSFFKTGTTTAAAVYADAARASLPNPVVADAQGRFPQIYPDPAVVYRARLSDSSNVQQWQEDGVSLQLFPQTKAETDTGATPVNYAYPPGNALRYGVNEIPGTTNMAPAINMAIRVAGAGGYRGRATIPAGAYRIEASIVPGVAGTVVSVVICGDGPSTQIINACGPGTPGFDGSGVTGWTLMDILFTGNSSNPNDGVWVDGVSHFSVQWSLERVICCMPGFGFKLKDTNTGVLRECKSWPSQGVPYIITPVVNPADIDHHIYMTGAFVHDVSIYDFEGLPLSNYKANQAGIRSDCATSSGLRVIGGVWQCDDNTRYAFNMGNLSSFSFVGPYVETARVQFGNCVNGSVMGITAGSVGASLELTSNTVSCTFTGVQVALFTADVGSAFNTFVGCSFITVADSAIPRNRFFNCALAGVRYVDIGGRSRVRVNQSGGGTLTIDAAITSIYEVLVNDTNGFTIGAPANSSDGMLLDVVVFNNNAIIGGGTMGPVTWSPVFHKSAFTNPANGFNRTIQFYFDGTSNVWRQRNASTVDIS